MGRKHNARELVYLKPPKPPFYQGRPSHQTLSNPRMGQKHRSGAVALSRRRRSNSMRSSERFSRCGLFFGRRSRHLRGADIRGIPRSAAVFAISGERGRLDKARLLHIKPFSRRTEFLLSPCNLSSSREFPFAPLHKLRPNVFAPFGSPASIRGNCERRRSMKCPLVTTGVTSLYGNTGRLFAIQVATPCDRSPPFETIEVGHPRQKFQARTPPDGARVD